MKRISPKEAKDLLDEGWVYLDVRSEPEYENGHPAGALNVPLFHAGPAGMVPNADFMKVVQAVLPKDTKVVVGCQSGGRSFRAAQMLEAAGYTQIVDQRAGFGGGRDQVGRIVELGWAAANLPVEPGTPSGRAYPDLARKAGVS